MEIKFNREIRDYNETMFFGLSMRQFFFSLAAVGIAVLLYLLLKDSFANSLIPFLALHFDIEAVDPRYATVAEMRALCESERFDKTLVLCSLDTILNERSVGRFLDVIG